MSQDIAIKSLTGNFASGEHDIDLNSLGAVNMVSGQAKLEQDIQKILNTINNRFWKNYGVNLSKRIGEHKTVKAIQDELFKDVTDALLYLKALQDAQTQYQIVDATERLVNIQNVLVDYMYHVTQNENDLFTYRVTVIVTNGAQQTVTVSALTELIN